MLPWPAQRGKGHPIQYEYMSDFFFIMLQLERYKTLIMLGLSIFTPVVLRTRALLIFILVIEGGLHLWMPEGKT